MFCDVIVLVPDYTNLICGSDETNVAGQVEINKINAWSVMAKCDNGRSSRFVVEVAAR